MGPKGDISIDVDIGPLGYVLWCCGSRIQDLFTFIQIDSGHIVNDDMSYFKNDDFPLDAYFLFHVQLVQKILERSLMDRPSYCDRQGTVLWSITFPLFVAFDEIRQIMCKLWLKSTVHTKHFSLDAFFQAIHNRDKDLSVAI